MKRCKWCDPELVEGELKAKQTAPAVEGSRPVRSRKFIPEPGKPSVFVLLFGIWGECPLEEGLPGFLIRRGFARG